MLDHTMMTIHFNAALRPIVGSNVGMLYFIADPVGTGFVVAYDLNGIQVHISPLRIPLETWSTEMCREKIINAIGKDVPFDVLSCRPWVFRREVATSFQDRNIFLYVHFCIHIYYKYIDPSLSTFLTPD